MILAVILSAMIAPSAGDRPQYDTRDTTIDRAKSAPRRAQPAASRADSPSDTRQSPERDNAPIQIASVDFSRNPLAGTSRFTIPPLRMPLSKAHEAMKSLYDRPVNYVQRSQPH